MSDFPRAQLAERIAALARDGIYVGTSSWKYEGWLGLIYSPENYLRYFKNGPPRLQKERFQRTCLAEYSQTFKTVCLDAGFYQFPASKLGNETADFSAARFLLKPGRSYEQAVKSFQPYAEIKEPYQEGRDALAKLLTPAGSNRTKRRYIYVNNRLEGCAPWTIVAALEVAVAGSSGTETK